MVFSVAWLLSSDPLGSSCFWLMVFVEAVLNRAEVPVDESDNASPSLSMPVMCVVFQVESTMWIFEMRHICWSSSIRCSGGMARSLVALRSAIRGLFG